jgi:hypothetical protein
MAGDLGTIIMLYMKALHVKVPESLVPQDKVTIGKQCDVLGDISRWSYGGHHTYMGIVV